MGFNNGYESGYDDAMAELAPRMRKLEAAAASGGRAELEIVRVAGPATGSVPLKDGALTVVPVTLDLEKHGGWSDRNTTGANRPDATFNASEGYVEMPDWDWYADPFYQSYPNLSIDEVYLEGDLVDSGDPNSLRVECVANVRYSTTTDATILTVADGEPNITVQVTLSGEPVTIDCTITESGDITTLYPADAPIISTSVNLYAAGPISNISVGSVLHDVSIFSDGPMPWPGDPLTFTSRTDICRLPSGFKLTIPEPSEGRLRNFQMLLQATGAESYDLSNAFEVPVGTTLVKETPLRSGDPGSTATLLTFTETEPGTVVVSATRAAANYILPSLNS